MNETIGVKGGHNDRRRMIIRNVKKKKLQQKIAKELEDLEKETKQKQIRNFTLFLPTAIIGKTAQILIEDLDNSNKELKESSKKTVELNDSGTAKGSSSGKTLFSVKTVVLKDTNTIVSDGEKGINKDNFLATGGVSESAKGKVNSSVEVGLDANGKSSDNGLGIIQGGIPMASIKGNFSKGIDVSLDAALSERVKEKKLLEEFEKQLKDVRYDLRMIIFEYNSLVSSEEEAVLSQDVDDLMDKLTQIIEKIDDLRKKMEVEDFDKYDDNYIYNLIQGYLAEFKEGKAISSIKDSPLYILISEKLDELEEKKDTFEKQLEEKKESLLLKEDDFEEIKRKYSSVEGVNKELSDFQKAQELLLKEVQERVDNAVTIHEKVDVQFKILDSEMKRALRMMGLSLLVPGVMATRGLAAVAISYLLFARRLMHPEVVTEKYKIIEVDDYTDSIKESICDIGDSISLLRKAGKQIDKLIYEINTDFYDYIDVVPECKDMLLQLDKMRAQVKEKEYEMERMKKEQKAQLEKNNAKILERGEYKI